MARVIAHRAGNHLSRLRQAEQLGIDMVEADVRLWRGRLEVRHLKTVGPLPILWDRWRLASPLAPRLALHDLLEAAGNRTELLLDLKGRDPRLSELVLAELPSGFRTTVCARSWRVLAPFTEHAGIQVVYSLASRRGLRRLLRGSRDRRLDGVSIHERLVDAATTTELRRIAAVVMSWPVNTAERARELTALGVDWLISDDLTLASQLAS
jgi:glycerophosphoryl diester phosphodiesterase